MALSRVNFRSVFSEALFVNVTKNHRRSTPPEWVLLTAAAAAPAPAPAQFSSSNSSFNGSREVVSAGPGVSAGFCRFSPNLGFVAQFSTKKTVSGSVEDFGGKGVDVQPYSSSELEGPLGESSGRPGPEKKLVASVMSGGGQTGCSGDLGSSGGGGQEEKVGVLKNLLVLGALVSTPRVGAASSGGAWWLQYAPTMHDLLAGVVTTSAAFGFVQIFDYMAERNVLDRMLSRKLLHIGVGLGFILFWPLFTISRLAPYLAAFAPAVNTVRFLAIGFGLMNNESVVKSMSRGGDRRELLKGPFYYGLAVVVTTVGFWRTSPVGIVALANLCAGDGFADLIGRKFGGSKLPYNQNKSFVGSLAFFIMSSLVSMLYLCYFSAFGFLKILPGTLIGVLLVSFLTALVESLPISTQIDDNFTVPFSALVFGMLLLPTS